MRHVGGEADEDHDDHPQAAAAFFKKGVDAVADIGDRMAAWGLDDVVAERKGDDEQGDADGKEHAFGVVTLDDETASSDEGEDADEQELLALAIRVDLRGSLLRFFRIFIESRR